MSTRRKDFHVCVTTPDLEATMQALGDLFGYTWAPIVENSATGHWTPDGPRDFTSRQTNSRNAPFRLELLQGSPGSVWDTDKAGLHHIGFQTTSFLEEIEKLEEDGWAIEQTMHDEEGKPSMYAYLTRPGQTRVEVLEFYHPPAR